MFSIKEVVDNGAGWGTSRDSVIVYKFHDGEELNVGYKFSTGTPIARARNQATLDALNANCDGNHLRIMYDGKCEDYIAGCVSRIVSDWRATNVK